MHRCADGGKKRKSPFCDSVRRLNKERIMSAGIFTEIKLKGASVELFEQIKAVKSYESSKKKQYEESHDCPYIESVVVKNSMGEVLTDFSDDSIRDFVEKNPDEILIEAQGPYGIFDGLGETGIFETIADASPEAHFEGRSSGFVTGAEVELIGELKSMDKPIPGWPENCLVLDEYYITDDALPELFADKVKEVIPYSDFCTLFKVDEDEFDEYEYNYFIEEAFGEEGFPDMEYEDFMDCCEASWIDEDEYEKAVERLSNMGIIDYDTFKEDFDYTNFLERSFYNPITKERKGLE